MSTTGNVWDTRTQDNNKYFDAMYPNNKTNIFDNALGQTKSAFGSVGDFLMGGNSEEQAAKAMKAGFDLNNMSSWDKKTSDAYGLFLQQEKMNPGFDWMGGLGLVGSAFDTFGTGGSLDRGKKNMELADAQIGALNQNVQNKQAFLDNTASAFA